MDGESSTVSIKGMKNSDYVHLSPDI